MPIRKKLLTMRHKASLFAGQPGTGRHNHKRLQTMVSTQERIADAFADVLRNWLTADQWAEMQTRNVDYSDGVCASHDFCDANMAMAEAFETVTGREPSGGYDTLANGSPVDTMAAIQADADCALWSAAWDIAKPRYLTAA
jgi:hypothetical protein